MRILKANLIEDATLTVSGANSAFPEANLYTGILTERVEFDNTIVIDLGASTNITAVAYSNTTDAITIEANTSDSWGAPAYSLALTAEVTFIDQTYRYWRINTGATDTRLGYFYLGEYLQLPATDGKHTPALNTTDIKSFTSGGQAYNSQGVLYNTETFNFPVVTKTERATFETWFKTVERVKNHFIVPFEDNMTDFPPYFGTVTGYDPGRDFNTFDFSIDIREAK